MLQTGHESNKQDRRNEQCDMNTVISVNPFVHNTCLL